MPICKAKKNIGRRWKRNRVYNFPVATFRRAAFAELGDESLWPELFEVILNGAETRLTHYGEQK